MSPTCTVHVTQQSLQKQWNPEIKEMIVKLAKDGK